MSDNLIQLRRKMDSAKELQSVVRIMKILAASSIGQYEKSVRALGDYYRTVEMGLSVCFRQSAPIIKVRQGRPENLISRAVVFGSDQGLVGQFNDSIVEFACDTLGKLSGKTEIWAVGERVQARLLEVGLPVQGLFVVPNSVQAIAPLVAQIQIETEIHTVTEDEVPLLVFHNQPKSATLYQPVCQRLLPLDEAWHRNLLKISWPSRNLPELLNSPSLTLSALIREYLFISLFKACAESLSSENAARMAAMDRADNNIDEMLQVLHDSYHRQRQSAIDEELFDVISGCEALSETRT